MEIFNERIDDVPLILGICEKMSIKKNIESSIKTHKNQEGLSNGEIVMGWIGYILSEGDHRKSHVSSWAEGKKKCLEGFYGKEVKGGEFSDERLTGILSQLSEDGKWEKIEKDLWEGTVEVMRMGKSSEKREGEREVWLDATSASCYHERNDEGLLQYSGNPKDGRRDLPQIKMMISVDKKSRNTIATDIVAGNKNDDILYLPNIKRVRKIVPEAGQRGLLYSGDSKMSSLSIRLDIAKNNECYLCPLQMNTKGKKKDLSDGIEQAINGKVDLTKIYKEKGGNKEQIGHGFEYEKEQEVGKGKAKFKWKERLQVIFSQAYFKGEKEKLDRKIEKGIKEIKQIKGKQVFLSKEEESRKYVEEKVEKIKAKYSLENLLKVSYQTHAKEREYERTEKRKGKTREGKYTLTKIRVLPEKIEVNSKELKDLYDKMGWRLYVTNAPSDRLSLQDAYNHYRGSQFIVENSFHILKDKPIGLTPIFVWKDDQIKGLMRLLTLCLKISSIISSKLRLSLEEEETSLQEIYPSQPKKKTSSPMTKTVLNLFYRQDITLTSVSVGDEVHWGISHMSDTCKKILRHLKIESVYENLLAVFNNQRTPL